MIWQTIDSAPKDGTPILVYCPLGASWGWGDGDYGDGSPPCYHVASWKREAWWVEDEFSANPSHWMPLPEPPK